MAEAATLILMYGLVPLWLVAGLGDWACHRRERIERNAGTYESALHLLMLAEVGVPVLLALFFEVNALVLAIMIVAVVVHAATAWWDVHYTYGRRVIGPTEQHMHGLLEVLPLSAVALVAVAHWPQALALFGLGDRAPDFSLTPKQPPLPGWYLAAVLAATALCGVLPFVEEFYRCRRWRREHGAEREQRAAVVTEG
ncbi:diguanylate cyclase [Cupriavidus cauae]|uniref:Diguanylate cyclase n=1 Tax=Cupriavidus cauae TaxID=2608999 RepID=A0A5M8B310_9BURK|nr:diguanylate cyclase [Cupriavidus cauae]KAA0180602.1 diguanylate cyclase [Cupriavidus gilardii]KAA6129609.1 diguanylate cyclase [Cupriavidus cauae]